MLMMTPSCSGADTPENCSERGIPTLEGQSLAMVYSPKQYWKAIYSPEEALDRGTLFTELDMPLMIGGAR